jgi:hypothetical protein
MCDSDIECSTSAAWFFEVLVSSNGVMREQMGHLFVQGRCPQPRRLQATFFVFQSNLS